jgi:hypothetical protein
VGMAHPKGPKLLLPPCPDRRVLRRRSSHDCDHGIDAGPPGGTAQVRESARMTPVHGEAHDYELIFSEAGS